MKKSAIIALALCAISCRAGTTYHVSPHGAHTPPFADWATAATDIQSAVNLALDGDRILVGDGTYYPGAEIVVVKNIVIESVNGPEATIVDGGGSGRCFNLGNSACVVSGLTVQNGYLGVQRPGAIYEEGGGIYCADLAPVITNCIVRNNTAAYHGKGGGISGGTVYDSIIVGNTATHGQGGGGGLYMSVANRCVIAYNAAVGADGFGGGMWGGMANHCLVAFNQSSDPGAGLCMVVANNCTVSRNSAAWGGSGVFACTLNNCIVWDNAGGEIGTLFWDIFPTTSTNCCCPELLHGVDGNITNAPSFIDPGAGDFRLLASSPCIDAGQNAFHPAFFSPDGIVPCALGSFDKDLDGRGRMVDGDLDGTATVDIGAYEFQVAEISVAIKLPSINLGSKGRCPVAVLSTPCFDAPAIDPASARFAGASPVHHAIEDVNHDGMADLLLHFMTQDLELDHGDAEALLLGRTYSGQLVVGSASVNLVPRKKAERGPAK